VPTLIVWGKADGIIAPAYAGEFARCIAHARVAMMEGTGHMPHFEQAENVARTVSDFLGA
jgi:pimeloyl-ACP methyl ester carboxylesterase